MCDFLILALTFFSLCLGANAGNACFNWQKFLTEANSIRLKVKCVSVSAAYMNRVGREGGGVFWHLILAGGCGEVVWPLTLARGVFPTPPELNRMNDTRLWKHNLRSLRYSGGNKELLNWLDTLPLCQKLVLRSSTLCSGSPSASVVGLGPLTLLTSYFEAERLTIWDSV